MGTAIVRITNTGSTASRVQYVTTDGTATHPADYTMRVGVVGTLNPGETSPPSSITIIDDNEQEGDEYFILEVSFTQHRITIMDNDLLTDIGGGMHAVARAEALVDNQPRLIPMLRSPGAGASEFSLRTSFRMSERLHIGGMLQFDRSGSEPDGAGKSGEFTGNGWMVGPYFAFRDGSNPLYFEGRLLYGRSSNDVEDYVPAQGDDTARSASLDSERWLIQGRVEGTHQLGNGMTLIPLADFSHARDEMEAFEDSRGIAGGSRTVAVTKLQFGAEFEIPVETARGDLKLRPGVRLVVSDVSNALSEGNRIADAGEAAEYRGRIDFGIDYRLEDDLVLGFESFYSSGRDREEFKSYGAGLNLQFEF